MITASAKKFGIVAGVYFVTALLVLVGTIYITEKNKQKFADVRSSHAQAKATQQLASTIEQTLRLSDQDRKTLDTFFISTRDTGNFITSVEGLARELGVALETTQLAVVPAKETEPSRLQIGFIIEGTYSDVVRMISALETLPYHRTITDVAIKKSVDGKWSGSLALYVTLQ